MMQSNRLFQYLVKHNVTRVVDFPDGAILNTAYSPFAAVETSGAILFADLVGFSKLSNEIQSVEAAYVANHFFAWFEGSAGRHFGGIVDKYIGDEVMMVFLHDECTSPPLSAAMETAKMMIRHDSYAFEPRIGIAVGAFAVVLVGTCQTRGVSVIGPTVNLAKRCCEKAGGRRCIRVASDDVTAVEDVFTEDWEISESFVFEPRNMPPINAIDLSCNVRHVPQFDYLEEVRANVRLARDSGAIRTVHS